MSKLLELQTQLTEKQTAIEALISKGEGLSAEEMSSVKALDGELDVISGQIKELKSLEDIQAKATERRQFLTTPTASLPIPAGNKEISADPATAFLQARASRSQAKHFQGCEEYTGRKPAEQAYRFGMWFLAACKQNAHAKQWCDDHGVKTMVEGFNDSGGALVPDEFDATLIDLRERYGVARQYTANKPMASDTKIIPRRTGGLVAYAVGEGGTITTSDAAWDNVMLVAKKWAVLSKLSSELNEDAIIDMGNTLSGEIAYAFSQKEDDCLFNGDGTSAFHGIWGIRPKLLGLDVTIANIAGLVVAAGNLWNEILLGDFNNVAARLPQYADTPNTRWYVSRAFYFGVMQKIALAAGGVTEQGIISGANQFRFLGYPVVVSQVMPMVEANSQVCAIFGDLSLGVLFGDRRMTQIALSEHSDFSTDLIAVRGTERMDINFHSPGNASATAALRVPGPVVALITAAS
jgi:HK97 family phage major capsid protein